MILPLPQARMFSCLLALVFVSPLIQGGKVQVVSSPIQAPGTAHKQVKGAVKSPAPGAGKTEAKGTGKAQPPWPTNKACLEFATALYEQGRREEALVALENELNRAPRDAKLIELKADIEQYDCRYVESIRDYDKVIALSQNLLDAYVGRGISLIRLGKYEAARQDLKKAIKLPGGDEYVGWIEEADNLEYDEKHKITDNARLWALACSALLMSKTSCGLNSLAGEEVTNKARAEERHLVNEYWGIGNRSDLLNMLESQVHDGHDRLWRDMKRARGNPLFLFPYRAHWDKTSSYDQAAELVNLHGVEFGDRGLLAWDYCRYICICRWGFICGYISEKEAWTLMMPMAARIQSIYANWEQLSNEYLVGRDFWSHDDYVDDEWEYLKLQHWLLASPTSPWVKLPWKTPLGCSGTDKAIYAAIEKVRSVDQKAH